ncbi:MAG: CAP domain-containing protein [Lachnospiraceae bacterium]|nr:CAP domain-containing protein [Lachnospiraceae bacterium]
MKTIKDFARMIFLSLLICFTLSYVVWASEEAAGEETEQTVAITLTVTYSQSEARNMLDMINDFRTGTEAWYWNADNETKTECTDLSELTYDYELEAIAMQRAAELAVLYDHIRPDGTSCETALGTYSFSAYGENIAYGYTSAEAVFEAWQETNKT